MQDRFKFRVVVFERYNTTEWEFTRYIENTDKFGVSTNGNVIQENVQGFIVHLPREKTPINVSRTMEAIQCTGLRDKNGKVVYFGDLVKNKWGQICKVIMQTDKQNYGRVILQNIKYLNDEAHKNNIFIPAAINESVIIGNIYENPELLEEK